MNISGESLLVILVVGIAAGWLAGQIVEGTGLGLVGDLIVGVVGALIASWILPQLGIHLGSGIVSAIVDAAVGAAESLAIGYRAYCGIIRNSLPLDGSPCSRACSV